MKMQAVRWLLVTAVLLAMASVAFAGPGTTTTTTTGPATTTTTTTTGPATTTTTGPTTTTTTGPSTTTTSSTTGVPTTTTTTTTTTAPPTTTTTSTTTTTTSTTTTSTTLAPGDLSGERPYFDTKNTGNNTALANISIGGSQFCWAGRVRGTDATVTPNRRVTFEYQSNGTVRQASDKKVVGDFPSVDLRLIVQSLDDAGTVLFDDTVTSACSLKASIRKEGDASRGNLRCDLGSSFSVFGLDPVADEDVLDSIEAAYPRRKNLKVNVKTGRTRFRHAGVDAPPGNDVNLTCTLSGPSPSPTPPPS
jgi:hypothetical protein